MFSFDLFPAIVLILITGFLAYNTSFLKKKVIWHMSILQTLYLVVFPGILFVIFYSYVQSVIDRPLVPNIFLSDTILTTIIMLAVFFTYGWLVIPAVTMLLAEAALCYEEDEV